MGLCSLPQGHVVNQKLFSQLRVTFATGAANDLRPLTQVGQRPVPLSTGQGQAELQTTLDKTTSNGMKGQMARMHAVINDTFLAS